MPHAGCVLERVLIGGVIADGLRVKNHHVGVVTGFQPAAVLVNAQQPGRKRRQPPHALFERHQLQVAAVNAQKARETAVRARVRMFSGIDRRRAHI